MSNGEIENVLKPSTTSGGRPTVKLVQSPVAKSRYVHQLVMEAFVGPRPEGMEVCHFDGDPANNHLANLRYDTRRANNLDRVRHGTHQMANRTHCPHGHAYTPENTVRFPSHPHRRECGRCLAHRTQARKDAARVIRDETTAASLAELNASGYVDSAEAERILGVQRTLIPYYIRRWADFPSRRKLRKCWYYPRQELIDWRAAHPPRRK
jgi:hypothetical protein